MAKLRIQSDTKPFTMIKNAIIDSEGILSEHEKILYIVLLRYGNKAFPSLATLSKKCGFSKSTAQRTIDALIEKGLLIKKNRTSPKNGNTSNMYILIDNDKIWASNNKKLKENIEEAVLQEAIKIVEASGLKVFGKAKGLETATPTKVKAVPSPQNTNTRYNSSPAALESQEPSPKLEEYPMGQIHRLYDYDALTYNDQCQVEEINAVMDVLHTTLNTDKPTIKVSGQNKPASAVKSRLMKLSPEMILYALRKFAEQTSKIKNPSSYMLSILYTTPEDFPLHISNIYSINENKKDKDEEGKGG